MTWPLALVIVGLALCLTVLICTYLVTRSMNRMIDETKHF